MFDYNTETTDVLIKSGRDYILREKADYPVPHMWVSFAVGRERGEDEPVSLMPDPLIEVIIEEDTTLMLLLAGPVVTKAFRTTEDTEEFVLRMVDAIEEDMEGISKVTGHEIRDRRTESVYKAVCRRVNEHRNNA